VTTEARHTNRLIHESSPYLLQHAHNPVDWYPWGEEALRRARQEDRPIFLSIGYSACHWCHVMERESFEDEETAALMNAEFVNIKVDREERPDLDQIYMQATQILTGHGGWPMSVWLSPDLVPFYAGTYFPPHPRYGMPSFRQVLEQLAWTWKNRREEIRRSTEEISQVLQRMAQTPTREGSPLGTDLPERATRSLLSAFDPVHGGFGGAPKFPSPFNLAFLLRYWRRTRDRRALDAVVLTLRKMARGGIYDQLGGGFHRYSVDAEWLIPHFEKMLYDNALLSRLYLEAWQATAEPLFRRVAEETLDYLLREMTSPEGGFYSTQDADSEGEEGKFFTWEPEEFGRTLGADLARVALEYYGVVPGGNFEHGKSVLHVPRDEDVVAHLLGMSTGQLQDMVATARRQLFEAREGRVRPGRDDKVLASWNGMALAAFSLGYGALGRPEYLQAARANASFVLEGMTRPDGRLWHAYKDGQARFTAYLDDYMCFVDGLLALYQVSLEERWLAWARRLMDLVLERFWDEAGEAFYYTDSEHEELPTRPKEFFDNATPSGNNMALTNLVALARLTGEGRYDDLARRGLARVAELAWKMPQAFGQYLVALEHHLSPPLEIALVGPPSEELVRTVYGRFLPHKTVGGRDAIFGQGKEPLQGKATAYVCRESTCLPPVTDAALLAEELDR
jgi:uncharacterized protein YyaL (SSP411 family)